MFSKLFLMVQVFYWNVRTKFQWRKYYAVKCGHYTKRVGRLSVGDRTLFSVAQVKEGGVAYCHRCIEQAAIRCAWCGGGIAVDDPIRLSFSCDPNHQYPDYAVSYRDACGRVSYVGCLRSNCANTGAEISGYWQMPGEVCRAPSVFDLVTQNPNSERVLYFRDIGSRKQTFGDLKDMTDQD